VTRTPKKPARPARSGEKPRAISLSPELVLLVIPMPRTSADELTPAERAVAELAAEGLTNAAIAARRQSSPHTVANLLAAAYAKLGISGRRELRARLNRSG
jgi:DNA-binding CsgD family transcriptional regulator